jgi:hypothetical protein
MRIKVSLILIGISVAITCAAFAEEDKRPNVYILIRDAKPQEQGDRNLVGSYWSVPGRVPNLAALLYGKTPLECGVVSDFDWRRKPVKSLSLADCYRKAGYHTAYFGTWGMGLAAPYDPASRGFDSFWGSSREKKKTLVDTVFENPRDLNKVITSMPTDKPWLCMIRCDENQSQKVLDSIAESAGNNDGVIVTVTSNEAKTLPTNGFQGKLPQVDQKTVGELYAGLAEFAGMVDQLTSPYIFYHQGNWPLKDSPEKHRHRGSVILADDFALVDGLELYPIKKSKISDETLDLDEYANQHKKLLSAHASWWKRASKAINNPRPFDVGINMGKPVHLTALDWRPSKIQHKEDYGIASQPMVYEETLLAMLRGLNDNAEYKLSFPAYSGSWSVAIRRPGRYKITARLLPNSGVQPEDQQLAKLQGGYAHIQLGSNKVRLQVMKGATSVSAFIDADQGTSNLECWFVGQLALERELGAFFVEIERVGDKKFDFEAKQQIEKLKTGLQK